MIETMGNNRGMNASYSFGPGNSSGILRDFGRINDSHDYHGMENTTSIYNTIQDVMYLILTPALCIIGCLGNGINLIVLFKSRVHMRNADGERNSGTTLGLVLLSLSDLLFCIANCPRPFINLSATQSLFDEKDFRLYYQVYGTGIVTTFILSSTWITVAMALLRYLGICHPLVTRKMDGNQLARITYIAATILSIALNFPSFWQYKIEEMEIGGTVLYLLDLGEFSPNSQKGVIFQWSRAIFGIFIPAAILTFCNCSLVFALRKSMKMRKECYVQKSSNRHSHRITRMLITIVIVFILLVFPSELMDFCSDMVKMNVARTEMFMVVRSIANILQVLNFSCNFLLYCVLSVHFRHTAREIFLCRWCPGGGAINRQKSNMLSMNTVRSNLTSSNGNIV